MKSFGKLQPGEDKNISAFECDPEQLGDDLDQDIVSKQSDL